MLAILAALAIAQAYPPTQVNPVKNGAVISASGGPVVVGNLFQGDIDLEVSLGAVTGGGSIVFTMTAADPLNPSATQGKSVSTASLVNGSNPVSVVLHAAHTSSVQVSWVVTGTFSAAAWVSVVNIAPGEVFVLDGGGTGGGGGSKGWDAGVIVQNQHSGTVALKAPRYTCCGTSQTAIAYSGTCLQWLNRGPNEVAIFVDGGTPFEALDQPTGTPNPAVSPGGSGGLCPGDAGTPLVCLAYTAGQTDGGCLSINTGNLH